MAERPRGIGLGQDVLVRFAPPRRSIGTDKDKAADAGFTGSPREPESSFRIDAIPIRGPTDVDDGGAMKQDIDILEGSGALRGDRLGAAKIEGADGCYARVGSAGAKRRMHERTNFPDFAEGFPRHIVE
jgi:hypothetical protein